ncbi:MAG: ACP S-malonyltransferase [Parahaliea sp.]
MTAAASAFIFPGQGSQKVGMLAAAHAAYAPVRATFEEASAALGYDMWDLICNGDQSDLNMTAITQPVLLSSSVALWRAWRECGGTAPAVMAGHSLGEFSALVCAGSLDFADAVCLVRSRGEFMQSAVPVGEGAMAAIIGVDDELIIDICAQVVDGGAGEVAAVNFNSPGQVVIAGHTDAVDVAIAKLKAAGAKRAMPLPVSAPFHTSLMQPAGEKLAEAMADIHITSPDIPVVHNVHCRSERDPDQIRTLMVKQIYSPVLWTGCVQTIAAMGVNNMIECGPGKVLSGLNRRIDKSLSSYLLEEPESLEVALAAQCQGSVALNKIKEDN